MNLDMKVATKYISLKQSAKTRGLDMSLSLTGLKNLYRAKKCYYSGLPMKPSDITIDRVDNSKGYVKGNVVACLQGMNSKKKDLSVQDIELLYKGVQKHIKRVSK